MLEQVCGAIHNFFIQNPNTGTYTISDGTISPLPSLLEGQRFWIVGSALNDSVYTYHAEGIKNDDDTEAAELSPETFSGSVCALDIPRDLIALSAEIADWIEKYGSEMDKPYKSETVIGVYSYEKQTSSKVAGGSSIITWQDQFSDRLKRWRKVCL